MREYKKPGSELDDVSMEFYFRLYGTDEMEFNFLAVMKKRQ